MLIYRIFRNSFLIIFSIVFLSLGINSCGSSEKSSSDTSGSDSDTSGSDSDSSPSSTVRTSLVSSGSSQCTYGGVKIEVGIDDNKNGLLDDSEVDKTEYVCHGNPGTAGDNGTYHKLKGFVQKGPYIQGTEINVREMFPYIFDDNSTTLIFTGKTYTGIIEDDLGSFSIKGILDYNIVELSAMGYYFNEITGALSNSNLNLQAISDLNDNSSKNELKSVRFKHLSRMRWACPLGLGFLGPGPHA